MPAQPFSPAQLNTFHHDGYIIVKGFCGAAEVKSLHENASVKINEKRGRRIRQSDKLAEWFSPPDNVLGNLARSEKLVSAVRFLLGGGAAVCHIQSKVMEKKPNKGGVWEWHQDFGYWQTNHFISPDKMVSVMVALTAFTTESGCSSVIRGSHQSGTLIHHYENSHQKGTGADAIAVKKLLQTRQQVDIELLPGDAIFFHSNLLHRSGANTSPCSSWSAISCYSLQCNRAAQSVFSSWNSPLQVLPGIAAVGNSRLYAKKSARAVAGC